MFGSDRLLQSCAWQNQYMASSWIRPIWFWRILQIDCDTRGRILPVRFRWARFGKRPASTCRNELSDILVASAQRPLPRRRFARQWRRCSHRVRKLTSRASPCSRPNRALAAVAVIGEATVASAPIRIRRLVAGRARTLTPVAIVRHAYVELGLGRKDRRRVQSNNRDSREQCNPYQHGCHQPVPWFEFPVTPDKRVRQRNQ